MLIQLSVGSVATMQGSLSTLPVHVITLFCLSSGSFFILLIYGNALFCSRDYRFAFQQQLNTISSVVCGKEYFAVSSSNVKNITKAWTASAN